MSEHTPNPDDPWVALGNRLHAWANDLEAMSGDQAVAFARDTILPEIRKASAEMGYPIDLEE